MTESTDAPGLGATHPNDSQDLVAEFLTRHAGLLEKVYGFIVRRTKDDTDTGGVYTETVKSFVGYLAKRGWEVPEEDYTPLLFRIATRRIIDSHRAHGRAWGLTEMAVHADLELLAGAIGDDPYEDVIRRIDVSKALDQLDEKALQVMTLRFVDGLTLEETAAVVGGSATRIFNITQDAKRLLRTRQLLDSYGPPIWRTPQTGTSEAQA